MSESELQEALRAAYTALQAVDNECTCHELDECERCESIIRARAKVRAVVWWPPDVLDTVTDGIARDITILQDTPADPKDYIPGAD